MHVDTLSHFVDHAAHSFARKRTSLIGDESSRQQRRTRSVGWRDQQCSGIRRPSPGAQQKLPVTCDNRSRTHLSFCDNRQSIRDDVLGQIIRHRSNLGSEQRLEGSTNDRLNDIFRKLIDQWGRSRSFRRGISVRWTARMLIIDLEESSANGLFADIGGVVLDSEPM